jgi:hypothetical protein
MEWNGAIYSAVVHSLSLHLILTSRPQTHACIRCVHTLAPDLVAYETVLFRQHRTYAARIDLASDVILCQLPFGLHDLITILNTSLPKFV